MSNVIPLLGPRPPAATPFDEFSKARCAMFRAFHAWLRTNPDPELVKLEIEGMRAAMNQLRLMMEAGDV